VPGSKMPDEWRRSAESRFRNALVRGDIDAARGLAASLAGGDATALLTLDALVEGVQQIALFGDCAAGEQLLQRCSEVRHDVGVRWLSWLWRAAAGVKSGRLDLGKTAADTALAMVGPLGDHSRASTLAVRAAIDFLRGDVNTARGRVVEAAGLYRQQHPDLHAALWLAWGRIMLSLGQARAGLRALNQAAQAADVAWASAPLARQALLAKRPDEAADLLLPFVEGEQPTDRVGCMVSLVEEASEGRIPIEVISEYVWLSGRPITDDVADQLEAFVDEQAPHDGLRELFAWDLEEAALYGRASQHFSRLTSSAGPRRALMARRALETLDDRERQRKAGLLDVIQTATWTKAAEDRQLVADTEAELFWVRWAIANGDLDRADADLACMATDDSVERTLVAAVQAGAIPLEVAREYVWIHERPVTDEMVQVLRGFVDDNGTLEHLRLLYARDLRADGMSERARAELERLVQAGNAPEVASAARRELRALGERRDVSRKLITGDVTPKDFVMGGLPWPSVLDNHSLLFRGSVNELHYVVVSSADERWVTEGETLASQGGTGELLYLVRSGEIRASRTRKQRQDLGSFSGGVYLGEVGTICGLPNTVTLEAVVDSQVDVISRRSLQESTRRSSAGAVLKTLRKIYFDTALKICALNTPGDRQLLEGVMTTQGRWRILEPGEQAALGWRCQLAILISGVARVVVAGRGGEVTLGYLGPGDLVLALDPSLVMVRANTVMTLAVFEPAELEHLSGAGKRALGFYLHRCLSTLRAAEVLTEAEVAAASSDNPLRTLDRLAASS